MVLDADTCRRVLNRAHKQLVEALDSKEVLQAIESRRVFDNEQIKDIRGIPTFSMQNRVLLSKISQKGVIGYTLFKQCLVDSKQGKLKDLLDEMEDELKREKKGAEPIPKERQEMLKQQELQQARRNASGLRPASNHEKLDKVPSDRDLVNIAPAIGSGWELLAAMLGITKPTVERIKLDHGYSSVEQIYNMLRHWRQIHANKATFRVLLLEMRGCNAVTIDWEELREKVGIGIELLDPEQQPMEIIYEREPRFRDTPAIPSQTEPRPRIYERQIYAQIDEARPLPHPNDLDSPLEGLSKTLKVVIKRDLFDGRLISLDESQIKEIMKVGNIKEIPLEAKGAQVFATQEKVPVFNTKLVIKQLQIDKIDVDRMKSITNEKLASRILHFGIVPLLAFYDDLHIDQHVTGYYYFVSPYFEGGTLFKAIKEDTAIIDSSDGHVRMCHKTRLKIIYQVASAISYLHTPVEGFRNDVLHMDIKSPNIVLDLMYNARLIDFGLAREMKEPNDSLLLTESTICGTEGYHPTTKFNRLTKFHDYHNFGVVIRELLTGLHPTLRVKDSTLRTMSKFSLTSMIQKKIWRKSKLSDDLLTLAESCIESIAQNAVENTFKISDILNKLDSLMREESADKWTRTAAKDCEKCEVCVVNNAVEESGYLEHDPPLCQLKINVCASCMRNSFLNPIMCHTCGNKLRPFIGENWGAILIAGNDKREKVAESFTEDVSRLRDVITSRSVPVMCIRKEKIEVVAPIKPGNEDNEMWIKVQRAFGKLKKQNITTLMVAYSGHHGFRAKQKAEGTNDTDQSQNGLERSEPEKADILQEEGIFILSENESMKDVDLCNEIQQLTTVDKVLVFEDCCHGDAMTHALKGKRVVQFNSSTTRTKSLVNSSQKKSQFIDALIKALTATDDKKREGELYQHANCQLCVNIADELFKKTFLTLETLHIFISNYIDHCKSTGLKSVSHPTFSTQNILGKDSILAYRYHFPVAFHFKIKKPKGVEIKSELIFLNEYENLLKLKEFLLRKLLGDDDTTKYLVEKDDQLKAYAAVVSIQVETGPREVHLNEIDSLEQASAAWTSRRELIAQIRNVTKIDFQNHAADIVSPKEVEVIFKELCLKPQHCAFNPSEEQVRLLIDADNLQHCVKQVHGKLERFGISQSLDHIDRVLRKKHEDVSNVKVHIVLPKINVRGKRQFGPLILYQLLRPSAEKES
ncbi:uncharacterized protein LOC128211483 [Mya arenaria]|nr:uncharacterized protein LOC128211483 [Mya arenaria]